MRRFFSFVCLIALVTAVPMSAFAQETVPTIAGASTAPVIQSWIAIAFMAVSGLVTLCSLLAHKIPPTTGFGKVVSYIAMNGGKVLKEVSDSGLIEKRPAVGYVRVPVLASLVVMMGLVAFFPACTFLKSEFGSGTGDALVKCETDAVQAAKTGLATDLQNVFAIGLECVVGDPSPACLTNMLAALETEAQTKYGPIALTTLQCDANAIMTGYEQVHGLGSSDAGVPSSTPPATSMTFMSAKANSTQTLVYIRAKAYVVNHH